MRICVLLVLWLQKISGDEIQRPVTLAVIPQAHWKIPRMDRHKGLPLNLQRREIESGVL